VQQGGSSGVPVFTGGMLVGLLLCVALLAGGWFGIRYVRQRRALRAMQHHGDFVEPSMSMNAALSTENLIQGLEADENQGL
jgi:hypothetical protein